MGSWQVSDIQDWNVLPGSPLDPPAPEFLTEKPELPGGFYLRKRERGAWRMAHDTKSQWEYPGPF